MTGRAASRWRDCLAAWAVPDEILAQAGESPWGHPVARFAARADSQVRAPSGASFERAVEGLEEAEAATGVAGSVLDVGSGAGAASLPLLPWASAVTAVDTSKDMLAAFAERARALVVGEPAITVREIEGSWPEAAAEAGVHDVVLCHHVAYNVADIGPFVAALTATARHRVVVEISPEHPLTWMNPLWLKFHGLERPHEPTADDLVAVLHELDVRALSVERWVRVEHDATSHAERVALATRRLCLPPDREPEVAAQLGEDLPDELRRVVTLTWRGSAHGAD